MEFCSLKHLTSKNFMKYFVLLFVVFSSCFPSCIRNATPVHSEEENKKFIDTSSTVIISIDSSNLTFPDSHHTGLSVDELKTIDSLLYIFSADNDGLFANDNLGHPKIDISTQHYKKQLVPFITSKGEKKVWVNFFCSDSFIDWRREIVQVKDGGDCYFNLVINLSNSSYSDFSVNGEA